jgi:hypothetical protein
MSKKVFNMAGGRHSAAAYSAFENRMYAGGIKASEESFIVSAGTGMQVSISVGDGLIDTGSDYARRIQITAAETATVSAASGSFGRLDSVVAYIDNAVTPTTGVTDNTNDILKFAVVSGTAAATPLAPSGATIQSAIGSGNPYMILTNVLVPQSAVNLNSATFTQIAPVAQRAGGFKALGGKTIAYASASTFTVAGFDATGILKRGTIIRLYQGSTVKWFIVESSTFSTNTTVTVSSRGLYTIANSAITGFEYTYESNVVGMPAAFLDGWLQLSAATYASSSTVTVSPEDYAAVNIGTKIWLTQTTSKFFYVTGKSGGNTLTLGIGLGYTVANAAITAPYWSNDANPPGYPAVAIVYNPYKFRGRLSTNTSTAASWNKIPFDQEIYDTSSNFDIATNKGRFTAPVDGYYHFSGSATSGQGSGNNAFRVALYKNGTAYTQGAYLTTNNPTSSVVDVVPMAAGDYVELWAYNSAGGSITLIAGTETWFSGYMVSVI